MELKEIVKQINDLDIYDFDLNKIDVNMTSFNSTLLSVAVTHLKMDIVERLIQLGADINKTSMNGITPLNFACHYSMVDMVDFLLKNGADCEIPNRFNVFPLTKACVEGCDEIIKMLLEIGAKIDVKSNNNLTPLIAYIMNDHPKNIEILHKLIEYSANVISEKLIDKKWLIDVKLYNGKTAYDIYVEKQYNCLDDRYLSLLKGESRITKVKSAKN